MAEHVSVDGFSLTGPARGGHWQVLDLEGWWSLPAVKEVPEKRRFRDGSDRVPILYDERLITIHGRFISKSHDDLHAALNHINALAYRGDVQMVVSGHGPAQTATVDPRGQGVIASIRSDTYLGYTMQLVAPDAYKYGDFRTFSAVSGVVEKPFQRGSVEAWPEMTVTGDMPDGYTVRFAGGDVSVPGGISAGTTDRIEYRSRRLYRNGEFSMGVFGSTGFRPCQVGVRHSLELIPVSGSGQIVMKLNDTYL